jgi:CDP-6-deoxy-D-xylo-4-hexulose-3-dehydrase
MARDPKIEKEIFEKISEYFSKLNNDDMRPTSWKAPIGGGYYDDKEVIESLKCLLHGKLSTQETVRAFEDEFSTYMGLEYGVAVNSGTSANILAINALLETGDLKLGDEVAIPATTYISVASPIVQLGLVPVYIDVELDTLNMDMALLEKELASSEHKIKAVMIVHTLGIPADMKKLMTLAKQHDLKVIEDCCEAHGAEFEGKRVGSFGDISAWSFYVAHHMTTGDGGMVATNSEQYKDVLRELREFGRDYSYKGERYGYNSETLTDYDERYTFRRLGWNFRISDAPAAFGREQLKKLTEMNNTRVENAAYLTSLLQDHAEHFYLPPQPNDTMRPVLYTYPIVLKDGSISRKEMAQYLEENSVETRAIMCGSLPDQPALVGRGRIAGEIKNARHINDNSFFVGCHPLLKKEELEHIAKTIGSYLKKNA